MDLTTKDLMIKSSHVMATFVDEFEGITFINVKDELRYFIDGYIIYKNRFPAILMRVEGYDEDGHALSVNENVVCAGTFMEFLEEKGFYALADSSSGCSDIEEEEDEDESFEDFFLTLLALMAKAGK